MKARQKATKQLWDGVTKMVQPLGKVLTSARKLANNLTKAELAKSIKKDMKKKVIQKQNSTLPVRAQVPKNSLPTFRETVDAFDAFRQKYRTREAATAALPTMERYKDTFVYNQVKEALKNGRYKDYIYMFEYTDENGMSGPLGSAREFSLFKNKNSNQLNINSNSNSSSQGTRNVGAGGSGTVIDNAMREKILFGQRKLPHKNDIIGGHSPKINNGNSNYAVEEMVVNADGTKRVKYTTQFPDGKLAKIKTSTLFPNRWSDDAIINAIKKVGDTPSVGTRDGVTLHRSTINGVEIEVMKEGNKVISGFPTDGVHTPGFN